MREAALVWERCDGHSSANDIARRVGLERERVAQALAELSAAKLIEQPAGISRRALYKRAAKLGAAGAAAASAPLIYSIAVPPPSAAQSIRCPLGEPCTLVFATTDCNGLPSGDECVNAGGAGCACQNLGACQPDFSTNSSTRDGICMTIASR